MIDWTRLASRLAALARSTAPGGMLSVTQALPRWPTVSLAGTTDGCAWQRPDRGMRLLGFGHACIAHTAGTGRFAALHATERGLMPAWHYDGEQVPLAFTGFAFAPQGGLPLPNAALWVPEILLREECNQVWLTLSCPTTQANIAVERAQQSWQTITTRNGNGNAVPPAPTFARAIANPLADQAFLARGRAALHAIAAGDIGKLVLSRTLRYQTDQPMPVDALLAALSATQPEGSIFAIAHAGQCFLGASPETLLELQDTAVAVDALAGTAWQADTLDTEKNRREHDFVAQTVAAALAPLCSEITVPAAPSPLQIGSLSHLRRRITARRFEHVSVFDLISRLHPTPAVGGTPTAAALEWLARHGEHRTAWYTGGFGWIDAHGNCDIIVPLRCGLLAGKEITLQAGAGFVAGSGPEQELAETEAKFTPMRTALAAAMAQQARAA